MTVTSNIPEPLLAFDVKAPVVRAALANLDATHARCQAAAMRAGILSNSVDALRVELTYHSNAIEGSTLTLRDTQLILEGQTPAGSKPLREVDEARNHDRAIRLVETWSDERSPGTPLADTDIAEIHTQVLADIDAIHAGRFRSERVLIKGARYVPPGGQKFDRLIPAMISLANRSGVHPATQAAELHYNSVAIRPFNDGNGRTARLLMNYHLLRRGCPLTIIEFERRAEYLAALEEANSDTPIPFTAFVGSSLEHSIINLIGSN